MSIHNFANRMLLVLSGLPIKGGLFGSHLVINYII